MIQRHKLDPNAVPHYLFYEHWYEYIRGLVNAGMCEKAVQLFLGISEYSLYHKEPDFDGDTFLSLMWELIRQRIDDLQKYKIETLDLQD